VTTGTRICPLCEACCGLLVEIDNGRISRVRPDPDDVFTHGYACVKGLNLGAIEDDPDRLRMPMVRTDGVLREVGWDEAFTAVAERLAPLIADDRNACAVYLGNPYAHNLDLQLYGSAMLSALRTRNLYSAATIDSMPRNAANGLMYGTGFGIPVPDIARTELLVVFGSNLLVSNGSTMSAPNLPEKLRDLHRSGGRLVVVDPVRTRTARIADQHLAVRPGADAYLLMAMVSVIAAEGLVRLRAATGFVAGLAEVLAVAAPFTPEAVAARCGIEADVIRALARELATTDRAAVHARIGANTQEFGTVCSWLVDVLNVITGNLDRPGGVMFALPPAGGGNTRAAKPNGWPHSRWSSRVRGARELQGELPLACLAEEIETPGPGQVRALITVAGNIARSAPNSRRLEAALDGLDFVLCIDNYLNETTRHADVILPGARQITRGHFDTIVNQTASHNVARYSPPLEAAQPGELSEREIMLQLAAILRGDPVPFDVDAADDDMALSLARRLPLPDGTTAADLVAASPHRGSERLLDLMLRTGPYPDLNLDALLARPHGIDLGEPRPRLPEVLRTASGLIELAPDVVIADVARLRARLDAPAPDLVLVGRRQVRGMNSWLHNSVPATRSSGCTLFVNPEDADRIGLRDGGQTSVGSVTGVLTADVQITDEVPPGVVSLPHGWGHGAPDTRLFAAGRQPGANVNLLTDDLDGDAITGTPCYTGIAVTLTPVAAPAPVP
jgi:formate dehydrogenase